MRKFPWKTVLAGTAILAVTGFAFAAQLSPGAGSLQPFAQMQSMPQQGGMMGQPGHVGRMHGQTMNGPAGGMGPHAMNGQQPSPQFGAAGVPTSPGQEAFGTIQEIVRMLEADPSTDWSKVDITALREHLIDMNEVTLRARASERVRDNAVEIAVTGEGRTLEAIKRMVPAHVTELHALGWNAVTEDMPGGVTLTVRAKDARDLARLKGLGFIGIMVQGAHHQPHHLMMAKGEMPVH
jgi:hypothetical protein